MEFGQAQGPELSSKKVLQATELILATYESAESARQGGRIDLPLTVPDSTILATA